MKCALPSLGCCEGEDDVELMSLEKAVEASPEEVGAVRARGRKFLVGSS